MVIHWSLTDSKSPQVSRILLSILAVLKNAVIWTIIIIIIISIISSSISSSGSSNCIRFPRFSDQH